MNWIYSAPRSTKDLPDHTQLPDKDGVPARNDFEPWQSALLTNTITPRLQQLHPGGRYFVGQDTGIYWRLPEPPEPVIRGAIVPDWCYVVDVDPVPRPPAGIGYRRSYVLWREQVAPLVVLEYADEGTPEVWDRTPQIGKFWIYEQVVRATYYGIYEVDAERLQVLHRVRGHYRRQRPNARGHFPIKELGLELGVWHGSYLGNELPWMRWYDAHGQLLPTGEEQAKQAQEHLEQAQERAARLAERLRSLGIDPEA
jgi:hypothetical protein